MTIDKDIKQILCDISKASDFHIEVMETGADHIHIRINSDPKLSPLQIVRRLKQLSTYRIWELHADVLRKIFWKEHTFWTDGYFVATAGCATPEAIQTYIENQKE